MSRWRRLAWARCWGTSGHNQLLPASVATTLTLDFHFRLQGQLEVEPISLSNASVQWSAAVIAGAAASQANSSAIIVFGPAPGNLDGEYLYTGDASLWGSFDQRFSLQHDSASSGMSGSRAVSRAHLSLVGLSYTVAPAAMGAASLLADGTTFGHNVSSLIGGLGHIGIRFVETGQILAVSAVPEPQGWALGLSGLMLLAWLAPPRSAFGVNPARYCLSVALRQRAGTPGAQRGSGSMRPWGLVTPWPPTGDLPMKRAILPLVLAFAASAAFACPGGDKSADAKAQHGATAVTSAQPTAAQHSKAEADKKLVKKVEAKKQTT